MFPAGLSVAQADTLKASGSAAAPGAGTGIAIIGSVPPAGIYEITVTLQISGAAETAALNWRLVANGIGLFDLPSAGQQLYTVTFRRVTLDGVNAPRVNAIAAAAVGTVYAAALQATRVE